MKRSADSIPLDNNYETHSKVILVERESQPLGMTLVNAQAATKISYSDSMELGQAALNVRTSLEANAKNKLDTIGKQMKNLHDLMTDVYEETKLSVELHNVACNFVKKPGHIYHLYIRPSGQKYLGMLSPEEWQNVPHEYLGSYRLEADQSWTPAKSNCDRYEGISYLLRIGQYQALTS